MSDRARELLERALEIINASWYGDFELKEEIRSDLAESEVKQDDEPIKIKCQHQWVRTGAMEPGRYRCIDCGKWGNRELDDKPVATLDHNGNFELLRMVGVTFEQPINLYTYPAPRKPFVRLTDEEKNVLFNRVVMEGLTMMQFVDAVENQLVEKNK